MVLVGCAVGGSLSSFMAIALHECTHDLVSDNPLVCKFFALLCNVGTPIPIAMSFRRYHADHHAYQGCELRDPDMPLSWERHLIDGTFLSKLLWLIIYPVMYGVRATVRGRSVTPLEILNLAFTVLVDIAVLSFWGLRSMTYLLIAFSFGYTFHPVAAHFLQEHYTFADGQETYDYYGWANTYFLNMGFHNEHHDFPAIPGSRLPFVTLIASEYYRPMKSHRSWRNVIWSFLTDSNIGPQSRCARVKPH
jgi:sphingolipid delta-4 desaturase